MDGRLANRWRLTVNEKKFIETALASNLRIDGRNPLEYRKIIIKFGREDGSSEVQLGQTHVMGFVTEFSPMADPSFEPGHPGESAVELGRIVDRGLRDSRAVDTESLCVLSGKLVWAIRIDLHIVDNGGNLIDAANIAALAALLTFRRPECTLGGDDGQEVIVHPPEEREPLPLIVHHLPVAITFAFLGSEGKLVVDPTHSEEAVMAGRMIATINSAVEAYSTERALRKIKRHPTVAGNVSVAGSDVKEQNKTVEQVGGSELSRHHIERLKVVSEETCSSRSNDNDGDIKSSEQEEKLSASYILLLDSSLYDHNLWKESMEMWNWVLINHFISWDPYLKGVDHDSLKANVASHGILTQHMEQKEPENIYLAGEGAVRCYTERERNLSSFFSKTILNEWKTSAISCGGYS
ncbi:hypothetical protein OIU85_001306 [Salix viminalis]|uniref:Uncharacterized protein n=1 Tax=Salix viminalis TaxID=40686 RepID=A0A9Q0VM41_SALVM|nr:hypothetical protein OIU85_001306 [Salix viminalis]